MLGRDVEVTSQTCCANRLWSKPYYSMALPRKLPHSHASCSTSNDLNNDPSSNFDYCNNNNTNNRHKY